ncbi:Mcm10/DnaG-type zinc finger protein [Aspergillus fijiensis CBS 313.89]|uniref:Zinc finger Mcm10/DnaG-type domain-containing protein n=1 Tax=Aspergillus fijiensis CBS 313.89 TaxID=1448319 RepID=A0A8G1RLP1_9EURO|nr:uncharacterized protein BO72DRAFT_528697 [Aspergillus fijiensis CBS 313.89]RAK76312.1 hypothetical protein BO72DRAFT_528697 [Aspergillus fijiensis CBS 313.89]
MTSMVDIPWPPKSPREALLSSPSGRKRLEELQRRQGNPGSPLKRSVTTPDLRSKAAQLLSDGMDDDDEDEDEDEETLKLKLAAIEARLKLKQLQKSRAKSGTPAHAAQDGDNALVRPSSAVSYSSQSQTHISRGRTERRVQHDTSLDDVQVPLSPTRRPTAPTDPVSPRRFILGIDKGLKSRDVSLKRPPSSRSTGQSLATNGNRTSTGRDGYVSHSNKLLQTVTADHEYGRPKSFSERMAESRSEEKARKDRVERAERIQASRSTAFHVDKNEVEALKAAAEARKDESPRSPVRSRQTESFSREDVLRSYGKLKPPLKRSQTLPSVRPQDIDAEHKESKPYLHRRNLKSESQAHASLLGSSQHNATDDSQGENGGDASKFEAFSGLHLSNRILPHSFLTRTLEDKKVLRIPDLLRTIKAPNFELPEDIDTDYVVFGIVASKSEPRQVKSNKNVSQKEADPFDDGLNNTNSYMVITLTDLKWTIDLFLFETAFPRYYRLSEGILVAILNPTIMPPPKNKLDTNKFSLAISSSDDTVLEVGYAQDLGFCKATRKDGKTCHAWVDGRKTEFCDFHVDLQVRKTQAGRMGVNNGPGMYGPGGRSGSRTGYFAGGGHDGVKRPGPRNGLKPTGAQYDSGSQSVFYVAPAPRTFNRGGLGSGNVHRNQHSLGQSAASLIDADTDDPFIAAGRMGRGRDSKEERFRKRLADKQREKDITEKLITRTSGVGAEYLRARGNDHVVPASRPSDASKIQSRKAGDKDSAVATLSLASLRKAAAVNLSPLKRAHDGGSDRSHGSSAVKKTRFITSHGIKEAGRDSLGGKLEMVSTNDHDDDDDELDII